MAISDELQTLIDDFCTATRQYAVTQDEHVGELRNADTLAYVRTWEALREAITAIETQRDQALAERDDVYRSGPVVWHTTGV